MNFIDNTEIYFSEQMNDRVFFTLLLYVVFFLRLA